MASSTSQNLEDQLRSMILGNVTIDPGPSKHPDSHSRGRGERGFHRGGRRGRSWHHHPHQSSRGGDEFTKGHNWRASSEHPQYKSPGSETQWHRPPRGGFRGRGRWSHGTEMPGRGGGNQRWHSRRGIASKFVPPESNLPSHFEQEQNQGLFLEDIASNVLPTLDMSEDEWNTKETFRRTLDRLCKTAIQEHWPDEHLNIELATFGSFSSGYAMPGSDMDLALVSNESHSDLPRFVEKVILAAGYGARLLSRTRVPILKICESPSPSLMEALREEREKWDNLTPEEQDTYDKWAPTVKKQPAKQDTSTSVKSSEAKSEGTDASKKLPTVTPTLQGQTQSTTKQDTQTEHDPPNLKSTTQAPATQEEDNEDDDEADHSDHEKQKRQRAPRPWFREKRLGPLDFPKDGVGVQCDINFSTTLGIHNTALLRCYAFCDIRVRLMVLFVKSWASKRKVNNSRSGTLSSYGYVLMVLHFLVNIANPPVCPNLQLIQHEREGFAAPKESDPFAVCDGYDIRFHRDEESIRDHAARGVITQNKDPLGMLLRQFFLYFAHQHHEVPRGGFCWTRDVLSLRTEGGLLSKQEKGWTGARTTTQENAEVRHRYLFAIEDPFELDHNVARTVTHNGIVAIRDEFRRAWRLIMDAGMGHPPSDGLMDVASDDIPVRGDVRGDRDAEDVKNTPAKEGGEQEEKQKSLVEVDW